MLPSHARAQHPPVRIYTAADGLVDNRVSRIVRDSRGFMWFCTEAGLSRFDGYTFTNYTVEQGLPDNEVNDLLEARDGMYWIATGKGLCRFNPRGRPPTDTARPVSTAAGQHPYGSRSNSQSDSQAMFTAYSLPGAPNGQPIKTLYEDRSGTLWCGTWQGLYRVDRHYAHVSFIPIDIGVPTAEPQPHVVKEIVEDARGVLWATTDSGLCRRFPDGRTERFTNKNGLLSNSLLGLLEDSKGRLWVGDRLGGIYQIADNADARGSIVVRSCSIGDGLPCTGVTPAHARRRIRERKIWRVSPVNMEGSIFMLFHLPLKPVTIVTQNHIRGSDGG